MPLSPIELMRNSIVCFEGKVSIVDGVRELILLRGRKEWIGGSMMNGELLTHEWAEKLSFTKTEDNGLYWADPKSSRIIYLSQYSATGSWLVKISVADFKFVPIQVIKYVHQLQVLFFGIIGEPLPVPRLPK